MTGAPLTGRLAPLVERALTTGDLVRPGDTVLAAVSGGRDSVVLLHLLTGIAPKLGIRVHAAHLNHGLRGEAAIRDQRFTERLCEQWNVPIHAAIRPVAARKGESPQAAARRVRYGFLGQVAQRVGAAVITTAHHGNDLAETVLMRLINGAGLGGLAAIPQVGEEPGEDSGPIPIVRPLLYVPGAELAGHARRHGLSHVEDASNRDPRYPRSRIRHELMPLLADLNPRIVETLTRQARRLADEESFLAGQAAGAWERVATSRDGRTCLHRAALAALPPALARRVVHRALCAFRPERVRDRHVEAVRALAGGGTGKRLVLPGGLTAECVYDTIAIGPAQAAVRATEIPLELPGITPVPWAGVAIEARYRPMDEKPGWAWFDPAAFSVPLTVRTRRPGDRFHPAGMGGHSRKLKDYFIDRKTPRAVRGRTPLVTAPEGLLWIAGERQDERFMVKEGAGRDTMLLALRLHAQRAETGGARQMEATIGEEQGDGLL